MANTNIDEIIKYPQLALSKIAQSQKITGLILDNQNIDMSSIEAERVWEHLYDYDYIDDTVTSDTAAVTADADIIKAPSGTIHRVELYVQVTVNKQFMKLKGFKGVRGNRRDNLAREIDLLLNKNREFGIGSLLLNSCVTVSVPSGFTAKLLTYRVSDFSTAGETA